MLNELGKLCLGCEDLVCKKKKDAYHAGLEFAIKNSHKHNRSEISSDGALLQKMLPRVFSSLIVSTYLINFIYLTKYCWLNLDYAIEKL